MSQAWKNLPATWLTASPVGSRHNEQHEDAADPEVYARVDAELTAAEALYPHLREQRDLDSAADREKTQPDADQSAVADMRGLSHSTSSALLYTLLCSWP